MSINKTQLWTNKPHSKVRGGKKKEGKEVKKEKVVHIKRSKVKSKNSVSAPWTHPLEKNLKMEYQKQL